MDKFGMKTMDDEPNHPLFGKNMKMMQNKYKERKFQIVMDEVIEDLVHVFPKEVSRDNWRYCVFVFVHFIWSVSNYIHVSKIIFICKMICNVYMYNVYIIQ